MDSAVRSGMTIGFFPILDIGVTKVLRLIAPQRALAAPAGIQFQTERNVITVSGIDKARVGEMAAKIRALKKPEPYKGKGIHYRGEVIRRKQGKKSGT